MDTYLGTYKTIDGNTEGYDEVVTDVLRYMRYSPSNPANAGR